MRVSGSVPAEERVISGIVTAISDTRLAFEVGGTVQSVDVKLGNRVNRGVVLARLDPEPFELAVRHAEAELSRSIAVQRAAQSDFERTTSLFEANVASRQQLDRDTASRDSSNSLVKAARVGLNLAQRDLRRSVLRAPFQGTISTREIDPAMEILRGQVAFEMDSEESGLRIEVQMPETLIMRVQQGDRVQVSFASVARDSDDSPDGKFDAVITEVGTRAGTGNAFPVRADLIETPEGLRPGMTAELAFSLRPVDSEILGIDGFLIPFAAVRAEEGDAFSVFVFDEASSTVKRSPIDSGGVRDNDVAVLAGLAEGDVIATAGVAYLRDGQTVRLADERLGPRAR
jgi:RND family efflux transporter MFP subunit